MPFDATQKQQIQAWIHQKGLSAPCPVCPGSSWHLDEKPYAMLDVSGNAVNLGGGFTFFLRTCTNCAYTQSVSLAHAGVSLATQQPPQPP